MHSQARRVANALVIGTILLLGQMGVAHAADPTAQPRTAVVTAAPSMPSGTLAVSPPIVNVTAPAGGTVSADVRLQSGIAQTVALQSQGLGQAGDGSFNYVATADDVNADSARSMVNVSPATISMQPGGEQKLTITVTVPQNVGDGIRYAMVRVTGTPGGVAAQQVGIAVELGVPVIVTISNTNLKKTGKLANLTMMADAPYAVDQLRLKDIEILGTVYEGRLHPAPGSR